MIRKGTVAIYKKNYYKEPNGHNICKNEKIVTFGENCIFGEEALAFHNLKNQTFYSVIAESAEVDLVFIRHNLIVNDHKTDKSQEKKENKYKRIIPFLQ